MRSTLLIDFSVYNTVLLPIGTTYWYFRSSELTLCIENFTHVDLVTFHLSLPLSQLLATTILFFAPLSLTVLDTLSCK